MSYQMFCDECDQDTNVIQVDIDGDDRPVVACEVCEKAATAKALAIQTGKHTFDFDYDNGYGMVRDFTATVQVTGEEIEIVEVESDFDLYECSPRYVNAVEQKAIEKAYVLFVENKEQAK